MSEHTGENDAAGIADDYRVPSDRESLGQMVRHVWVEWAREQDYPKPSWLVPWEELDEPDREVDRRIGETLYLAGYVNALAAHAAVIRAEAYLQGVRDADAYARNGIRAAHRGAAEESGR